jgi:UDP-N-acetylglucosamine 2-epimerase (non-hydrolysing)
MHPRTRARMAQANIDADRLRILEPLGYLEFLGLQRRAAVVITDSGGIQEETTYLGVPCFTLRDNTERPVTVRAGTNTLLGLAPERITEIPALLAGSSPASPQSPEKWDGQAARRVADALEGW